MRTITLTTTTTALIILLGTPIQALHCNGDITAIDAGGETLYLDDRSDTLGEIDHWLYLESNGMEGLQSGAPCSFHDCAGPIPGLPTNDRCMHFPTHDLLIV